MPKRLRTYPIYLAPKIRGLIRSDGSTEVYDEKHKEYLNPNSIDGKIIIYERQVKEWFLERASRLLKGENNGFIVLMISTSYIEGVQQYINGQSSNRESKTVFKQGLNRIFSLSVEDRKLNDFYSQVRCGLFHNGMSDNQVIISYSFPIPIDFSEYNTIKINPKTILDEIRKDFRNYISKLKKQANVTERENFNRMFSVQ
jgi:hypothetical protein